MRTAGRAGLPDPRATNPGTLRRGEGLRICFFILKNKSGGGPDGRRDGKGFVRGKGRTERGTGWVLIVVRSGRGPGKAWR
jgi:hypothetical protein